MPISQDRVVAIITAGINFRNSYTELQNQIKTYYAALVQHPEWKNTPEMIQFECIALVNAAFNKTSLTREQDVATLLREHDWFRVNGKDNNRRARNARLKREKLKASSTPTEAPPPQKPYNPFEVTPIPTPISEDDEAYLEEWNKKSPPPPEPQ